MLIAAQRPMSKIVMVCLRRPLDLRPKLERFLRSLRYLLCGEGRVDHIAGYTDGLALWKSLAESGIRGIIRGDNLFGCSAAATAEEAAAEAGLLTLESMRDPLPLRELGIDGLDTAIPERLARRSGETAQDWYHRLMHGFRHPAIIAALNEIKSAYVEIANPLNIHSCVAIARTLPPAPRTSAW